MNEQNRILDYATPPKRRPLLWLRITCVIIVSIVAALILFNLWWMCHPAGTLPPARAELYGVWPWLGLEGTEVAGRFIVREYSICWETLAVISCVSMAIVGAVIWFARRMLYNKP